MRIEDSRSIPELAKALSLEKDGQRLTGFMNANIPGTAAIKAAIAYRTEGAPHAVLPGQKQSFSVTELEVYLRCPYDYLVTKVLGLKPVFKDAADLEAAIQGAANAIFFNHGQCCCAGSRLLVEQAVFDEVVSGVAKAARKIKLGSGLAPDTQMGPLVSEEQLNRVTRYLHQGEQEGACYVAGGRRLGEKGYFVQPTVATGVTPKMSIVREEIFGPVVVAESFTRPEEVIPRANATPYGLAAGVWTNDIAKAHRVAAELKAGTVWINCYNVFDAALPFGGYKQSGWGREMGHEALELYTETKAVVVNLS